MIGGWACVCFAHSYATLLVGRAMTGFCSGVISVAIPGYVWDITTPNRKRFFGITFQIMICAGELYLACFGSMLDWNQLAYVAIVPTIICSLGMWLAAPNTPVRHLIDDNPALARKSLLMLRASESDVDGELQELQARIHETQLNRQILRFSLLTRRDVLIPSLIVVLLMGSQQFSGVNTFLFNLRYIFEGIGANINSNIAVVIIDGAHLGATIHTSFIVDKFGCKMLLLISGIGQIIALLMIGVYYRWIHPGDTWIPVACLMLFIVMFSVGFGPIPWMITGELVSHEAIPLVSSLVSGTNWTSTFIITETFNPLTSLLHKYGVYWLFAGFSTCSVFFTLFFLPETKGRTIEEIQRYFNGK